MRVLIVDDDYDMRVLLRLCLEKAGCDVVGEARDGFEGIKQVEHACPEVVVMDLMMPVLDGLAATKEIRRRWPGVEVMGLTSAGCAARHKLMTAGASACFDKGQVRQLAEMLGERS